METNKIHNRDCLEGMKKIPDESVHLIITDPPFNIGKEYNSPYKDKTSKETYLKWCKECTSKSYEFASWGFLEEEEKEKPNTKFDLRIKFAQDFKCEEWHRGVTLSSFAI